MMIDESMSGSFRRGRQVPSKLAPDGMGSFRSDCGISGRHGLKENLLFLASFVLRPLDSRLLDWQACERLGASIAWFGEVQRDVDSEGRIYSVSGH